MSAPLSSSTSREQARSPRSFQAKNTKNLSLNISKPLTTLPSSTVTGGAGGTGGLHDTSVPRPVGIGETMFRRPTPLASRRSDAAIYTRRRNANINGNNSDNNNNNNNGNRLHRVHSLSLSVRTTELGPPASSKQMWVLPHRESFDEGKSGTGPGSPDLAGNAYPEGPLCVVPQGVYLYSEPSLEQVLQFDLVINVAAEIADLGPLIPSSSGVEYVRIPWTHNSKISGELSILTETIHLAQQRGKKVLVHCQCGISRSASLVVAYIMRYGKLSLNDAYERLKRVACDISPNMGLIFQLMEWGETIGNSENFPISSSSNETTPRTPGEYCKNSLSSASTCSSSTVVSERERA